MTCYFPVQDCVFEARIIAYLRAILGGFGGQTYRGASRGLGGSTRKHDGISDQSRYGVGQKAQMNVMNIDDNATAGKGRLELEQSQFL